ncbi:MAG TPA: hypothetical protein VIY52_30710 [Streptosporangiaceae bacterium]
MTATTATSASQQFPRQAEVFTDAPARAARAAAAGDYRAALDQVTRLELAAVQLRQALLREVIAAGADWQEIARLLGTHPQQAFEACAQLTGDHVTPAQQQPGHAVVLTAGLAAVHDIRAEYGIDIEDLDAGHSLHAEPGVRRVRDAARLLGEEVWICVTIPGGFEGAEGDPGPGEDVILQWTSVVTDPGELHWAKEMLVMNAAGSQDTG